MKLLFYEPESVYLHRPMVYHKITLLFEVLSKFFEYFLQNSGIIGNEIKNTYTKFTCRHLFVLYQETSRKVILDFIFTFDMIIQYKKIVFD